MTDGAERRLSPSRMKALIKEVPWYSWIAFSIVMSMAVFNIWAMMQADKADIDVAIEGSRDSTVLLEVHAVYDDGERVQIGRRQVMLDIDGKGTTRIFIPDRFMGAQSFELTASWRGLDDSIVVEDLPSDVRMYLRESNGG